MYKLLKTLQGVCFMNSLYIKRPLRLYLQLRSLPIVSPKNVLAAAYSINIYASFRGAFPSFVYTKLQCNEENLSMTYQKERARHTGRAFSFVRTFLMISIFLL